MDNIAISVSNVSKCYSVFDNQRSRLLHTLWPKHTKGKEDIWALKDISFEIKRGEAVAIIGRNGGGKSTLLEILTGTLMPTTGRVRVNGRVSALLELGSGFNPEYSGRENVILNGLLLGLRRDDILGRFAEIEAFAEVGAAIDRPVKTYSSGMVMRLAFAVQVLCDPDILIIDEALSVGDFFFQQKCLRHIRAICDKGVTLLFVSHDMGTVRDLCERGIFLHKGGIRFDGENLHAIRHYLQPSNDSHVSDADGTKTPVSTGFGNVSTIRSEDSLWCLASESWPEKRAKLAFISAVDIVDAQGASVTTIKMSEEATIRVQYRSLCNEPLHIHVAVKNKYDQIVTAVGSFGLGLSPPELTINQDAVFSLVMQFSLEAGEYVICASLVQPSADKMTGSLIDETPWLGPVLVGWDYGKDVPPFYGLCGMKSNGEFLVK